jgi:hypothetical protein
VERRLYVEMDIAPAHEQEMLDLFHNQFVLAEFDVHRSS